jgi:hypothetical protein
MSAILMLVGAGLRIVLDYPKIRASKWIVAGAILCCCILTRHINSVLAALLPVTMFMLALARWLKVGSWRRKQIEAPQFEFALHARVWATSIALGVAALVVASGCTHFLCRRAHIRWRPKVGVTFVWRLNFLQAMPPAARHARCWGELPQKPTCLIANA